MSVKRFLIISSYAPPAVSGAPLLMYYLLQYFPLHTFCFLTSCLGQSSSADEERRLPVRYYFYDTPAITATDKEAASVSVRIKTFLKRAPVVKCFAELLHLCIVVTRIVYKARRIMIAEKLNSILAYSDHGPSFASTYFLHRMYGIPYDLYFYDLYAGNKLPLLHRILARVLEPRLLSSARHIFVMSEALAAHYRSKYTVSPVVLHNAVPPTVASAAPLSAPSVVTGKIVYTGTVYWAQADAVQSLVRAVELLNDTTVQLWLYTPHDPSYLAKFGIFPTNRVIFSRYAPHEAADIHKTAAVLVVALGFETGYDTLIATSSPAKTYEYLASGRPVLVYAPEDSYISSYLRRHEAAVTVGKKDERLLANRLSELLANPELQAQYAARAYDLVRAQHDSCKVAHEFMEYFE